MPKWTDETTKQLEKLWVAGKTAREIGDILGGFSRNAVIGKANRMGLSTPKGKEDVKGPTVKKASNQKTAKATAVRLESHSPQSRENLCQWPHGEPGTEDFHFCHAPSEAGRPYCAEHCEMAYRTCS